MTRIKFFVFAVIALVLWGVQLSLVSPALSAKAVESASAAAAGAPSTLALRLEGIRSALQTAALKVANSPATLWPAAKAFGKPDAPAPDRVFAVRAAAKDALPAEMLKGLWVGVQNDQGALWAQSDGDPAPVPESVDVKAWGAAGANGLIVEISGTPHWVFSVPVMSVEKNEAKVVANAFVGMPALGEPAGWLEGMAKQVGASGLGIASQGRLLFGAGSQKPLLDKVLKGLKAGEPGAVDTGALDSMGPVSLPMMVGEGGGVLAVGVRKELKGTPYEVLAVVSTQPFMKALADYQKVSLLMLLGLLVGAIAVGLMLGGGESQVEDRPLPSPIPSAPLPTEPYRAMPSAQLPLSTPLAPETHPDDFDFGGALSSKSANVPSGVRSAPAVLNQPSGPIVDEMGLEELPGEATATAPPPASQATTMDEAPADDPFSSMGSTQPPVSAPYFSAGDDGGGDDGNYNPESTRVATVPAELLQATSQGNTEAIQGLIAASGGNSSSAPKVQPMAGGSEEEHFQATFREFVATRERCGEPSDGLTFDKFVVKLRKNKEQLVAKYNCRSVRFQVYVKEGKAALKATPVKD
jgi:hypothetical protein